MRTANVRSPIGRIVRGVWVALGPLLVAASLVGAIQSAVRPASVSLRWASGRYRLTGGVSTDHFVLRVDTYVERSESKAAERSISYRPTQFRFFHPKQLVPFIRIASPRPTPDLQFEFRVHYLLLFLSGTLWIWVRSRRHHRRRIGFALSIRPGSPAGFASSDTIQVAPIARRFLSVDAAGSMEPGDETGDGGMAEGRTNGVNKRG